jgi:ABC-type transport system involved in cytochrome c biogenesis permease subunit
VSVDLHSLTAALYLAAAVLAALGVSSRHAGAVRAAVWVTGVGALCHGVAFFAARDFAFPPPSTGLPGAVSLMSWLGVVFFLSFGLRHRLRGLSVVVAPLAFVGVFFFAVARPIAIDRTPDPAWGVAHVLLASAGLALLGVAGAAGILWMFQHRDLKAKRAATRLPLPPLEALDRVNGQATAVGFLLLTLGLVTGVLWVAETEGRLWPGTPHANATSLVWVLYAGLLAQRVFARAGARQSALSSAAGFALMLVAVVGVGAFE